MFEVLKMRDTNTLGFKVDGRVEKTDVQEIYRLLEERSAEQGKIKFYAEIEHFGFDDFSMDALKEDIRLFLKHPGLVPNIAKVALVTDSRLIGKAFDLECALIPTLEGESFSLNKKDEALEWLKTDQREPNRLDITFSELAQISTLKFAAGIALGLLTAGLFSGRKRKNLGSAIMFGTFAAGIPFGIKVLNNNRHLLKIFNKCERAGDQTLAVDS